MSTTDRIEKTAQLRAPVSRVWRALTDAAQFGEWFRCKLDGAFEEGKSIRGNITLEGYEHFRMELDVVKIEPEKYFAYRWHPYPSDPNADYSGEEPTLVEFRLEAVDGGTKLTVVESGFDRIPAARRDEAFRMNERGWTGQLENVGRYVS